MNSTSREDLNYLLGANPDDFDYLDSLEAYHTLTDVLLDLQFQLMASAIDFQGSDREAWAVKAQYKSNRTVEAAKRFSRRVRELKETGAQSKIDKIAKILTVYGQSNFTKEVEEIING